QFVFLHLIVPYFFSISVVFSSGSASTVCPRPVVVARGRELYTASSVASITARNSGDIASFGSNSVWRGDSEHCLSGWRSIPVLENDFHREGSMYRRQLRPKERSYSKLHVEKTGLYRQAACGVY